MDNQTEPHQTVIVVNDQSCGERCYDLIPDPIKQCCREFYKLFPKIMEVFMVILAICGIIAIIIVAMHNGDI
jgi:hypothetical protein